MDINPIRCRHTTMATMGGMQAPSPFPQEPAQVEVRIGNLLEKIESRREKQLDAFLEEHEKKLTEGYETHSGTQKRASSHAWKATEKILNRVFQRLFEAGEFGIPLPTLSANRSGTVDITWRTNRLDLLANVPAEQGGEVEYSYWGPSGSPSFGKAEVDELPEQLTFLLADLR